MKYINNKSLAFEQDTTITVTKDINFLLRDVPPYVRELINSSIKDSGKLIYIEKLKKHLKRFPNVAFLYKLLADEYTMQNKEAQFIELSTKFYKKFPNDFFAKLNMARAYMLKGNVESVQAIYGDDIDLVKTFPDRLEFHYSEILDFLHFAVRYTLALDLLDDAIRNEMKIGELEPNGSTHRHAKSLIERYRKNQLGAKSNEITLAKDFKLIYPHFGVTPKIEKIIIELEKELINIKEPSSDFLVRMQIMADKYDDIPFFKLLISNYHHKFENAQSHVDAIQVLFERHPNFLFGKIEMAQLLLNVKGKDGDDNFFVKEIVKMFDGDFDFNKLKPVRKLYHVDEFIRFHFLVLRVWLRLGKLSLADACLKTIERTGLNPPEYKWGKQLINEYNDSLKFNNLN